jgi:preprotein translocase subunit Sss1
MPNWTAIEKSPQRVVTQQDLQQKSNLVMQIIMLLLISIPGGLAIWIGLPVLPKTLNCQPVGNIAECQEVSKFFKLPVKKTIFQQTRKLLKPTQSEIPGDMNLVGIGLAYLGAIGAILLIFAWTITTKEVWIFDKHRQILVRKKYKTLRKIEQKYHPQDIFNLSLEITDLLIDSTYPAIFAKINLADRDTTKISIFSPREPVIYDDEYDEFTEIISMIVNPISTILKIPWQLKFFFDRNCYIFNFDRQCIEGFTYNSSSNIPFQDIHSFEIESLFGIHTKAESLGDDEVIHRCIIRLILITKYGGRFPIHQAESRDDMGRNEQIGELRSIEQSRSYQWMKLLIPQLLLLVNRLQLDENNSANTNTLECKK